MNSSVNLEVLFLTEGLITAQKCTLEGLCPIMDMHVDLKAILSSISLIAAWMLADKKLRRPYNIEWTAFYGFQLSPIHSFDFDI